MGGGVLYVFEFNNSIVLTLSRIHCVCRSHDRKCLNGYLSYRHLTFHNITLACCRCCNFMPLTALNLSLVWLCPSVCVRPSVYPSVRTAFWWLKNSRSTYTRILTFNVACTWKIRGPVFLLLLLFLRSVLSSRNHAPLSTLPFCIATDLWTKYEISEEPLSILIFGIELQTKVWITWLSW